jgi:hypothetical protein
LFHELGTGGFITFQLVVGGNVLAALLHPAFLVMLIYALARERSSPEMSNASAALTYLFATTFVAGYVTSILVGLRGLARRNALGAGPTLVLVPVHWLLLSLAAWRALYQLIRDPHGWEKTEHGLARTSRRAKMTSAATLDAIFPRLPERPRPQMKNAARRRRPYSGLRPVSMTTRFQRARSSFT